MVHGTHITFSTYGFWLPNDPRGSGSDRVRVKDLYDAGGEARKVSTRRSVASRSHDTALRKDTKSRLKFPPVEFTGIQAKAVAQGFSDIAVKLELTVYACSIMPDHVHLVAGRHEIPAEKLSGYFKRAGSRQLSKQGLHPLDKFRRPNGSIPSPWAMKGWEVFLNLPQDMQRAIRYVEANPVRAGLRAQHWSFVVPYEG
jgi:REP element-mobilizing transposase RayT